ncbi:MAG TPA: hypothetical protein VMH22_07500 [bacterium]|nr:hypothetical protein [bacterium]
MFCLLAALVGAAAADSLHFRLVGKWGGQQPEGVAVQGEYAYTVGTGIDADGLFVISVANPANPIEVGHSTITNAALLAVAVSGNYAYVAEGNSGLMVISVADPANPVEVSRCTTCAPLAVTVSGDHAYATSDVEGLRVISIADPLHPVVVGRYEEFGPGHAWSHTEVVGDYAYITDARYGLQVISVADPTHPVKAGEYLCGTALSAAVSGSYAYVGCDSSFRVASLADPANPVEVGRFDSTALFPHGVAVTHGYAFVAAGYAGLWAILISDPTRPTLAGYYQGGSNGNPLAASGDYVYFGSDSLRIFQFYQLGDLDIDNDSLDVTADTLRPRKWTTVPGDSYQCARGEFVLANTSAFYNPDSTDGPSTSPVDSIRLTCSLTGPGGTIDSVLIPNLPTSLAQGQPVVCTLAAYVPVDFKLGDYIGSIYISGEDTANLQVYESCYVRVSKLGDIDVDNDSLDVVADTLRLPSSHSAGLVRGMFVLANTSASYNPDTADGPSLARVDSLRYAASLAGPGGTLDSILIKGFPAYLARGQAVVCTLAVHMPESLAVGDYAGSIVITGLDSVHYPVAETVQAVVKRVVGVLGDLDVDKDSLGVAHDTMNLHTQPAGPVYHPYAKAEFMLANTSSAYNPDTTDGPSRSPLREVKVEMRMGTAKAAKSAKVHTQAGTADSIYVLNLPESLAVGQAVKCTLALVIPVGEALGSHSGWIVVSALDTLGYQVRDSFFLVVRGPQPRQNLDSLRVAPIPFKPNQNPEHDAIHFQGLSAGARVIVYDASGQSVWSATESGDGQLKWDAKVASGIYVYLVVSADGKSSKVGKLSVIR